MRYYEYMLPQERVRHGQHGQRRWEQTRSLKGRCFPRGTKLRAVITNHGEIVKSWNIPTKSKPSEILTHGLPKHIVADFKKAPSLLAVSIS